MLRQRHSDLTIVLVAILVATTVLALPASVALGQDAEIDCKGAAQGDSASLFYVWTGANEESFLSILKPVLDACGINVEPEASRDQALLDTRVKAGTPWDIVIWPSTAPVVSYSDLLQPLSETGANSENYEDYWISLGSVNDTWLAVPVKADVKSVVWYSPVVFEALGYEVPATFEDLQALVEQMAADGNVAWSMGFESGEPTGWAGSDFIQDILLATQGPGYVLGIIDGSIPYNDAAVADAYQIYAAWASDEAYTVGGAQGTLSTGFLDAIYKPFADPPEAMMVKQSGFAGGVIVGQFPELVYGEDYDFFSFPGAQGMQGGADWLMVFNASPAVQAIVAYLTSEAGAQRWAEIGFDLSPNRAAPGNYQNAEAAKKGDALAAASGFTPDLGDTIPGSFGGVERSAIIGVVSGTMTIEAALDMAAAAQAESLGQ